MVYTCNECNFEVNVKFSFCPECGTKVTFIEKTDSIESDDANDQNSFSSKDIIICENCGDENTVSTLFCESCGDTLDNNSKTISEDNSTYSHIQKENSKKESLKSRKPVTATHSKSGIKKKKHPEVKTEYQTGNKLSNRQLGFIIGIVLFLSLIVLIGSGVFDKKPTVSFVPVESGSGQINLQNLEKINQLEEIIKANPENHSAMLELANLQFDSGLFERAIIYYRQYLEVHPDNADARIDFGVCYYELREYDKAIKEMETALQYKADHQIGHFNLGIVNLAAGNSEKAKEWWQKTINIDPLSSFGTRAKELIESH